MKDFDIIKQAAEELENEHGYVTSVIDKKAFNINIDPSSAIGAITGAAIAKNKVKKDLMRQQFEADSNRIIGSGYYKQVENVANNMKVVFTPFNVIYVLNHGTRQITLETISTEEMDDNMHRAYLNKDEKYFKNLLLNKMSSEIQLAEQMFARRIVQKQMDLQDHFGEKTASDNSLMFGDVIENICDIKEVFEKNANSALGNYFINSFDNSEIYSIEWGFDDIRPLNKYAGVIGDVSGFFGLNLDKHNLKSMQKKMLDESYLNDKLRIDFLPDRVVFMVDGVIITQLPAMAMNEKGFEAFERSNRHYFAELFKKELAGRMNTIKKNNSLEKMASEMFTIKDIFSRSNIHPKIYHLELIKTLGERWIEYDPEVLIKEIEDEYQLESGITEIPLNKILSIQLINKSMQPFTNHVAFEKCVRSFNDKPIDFTEAETNIDLGEIIFALKLMQDLTPADDIYDNFTEEVFDYIADTLVVNNFRAAFPQFIVGSNFETQFYSMLNDKIIELCDMVTTDGLIDSERVDNIKKENRTITAIILKLIDALRDASEYNSDTITRIVTSICDKLKLDTVTRNIIAENLRDNIAVDVYIQYKDDMLDSQRKDYNV